MSVADAVPFMHELMSLTMEDKKKLQDNNDNKQNNDMIQQQSSDHEKDEKVLSDSEREAGFQNEVAKLHQNDFELAGGFSGKAFNYK